MVKTLPPSANTSVRASSPVLEITLRTSYLYLGVSNGQVVQIITPLGARLLAIEIFQQQYPFPNVRRIFTSHKAPGVLELRLLRNVRRVQLFVIQVFEFLERDIRLRYKMT